MRLIQSAQREIQTITLSCFLFFVAGRSQNVIAVSIAGRADPAALGRTADTFRGHREPGIDTGEASVYMRSVVFGQDRHR